MGLLSTEVEVTLVGKNIPYYENLGYEIPRIKRKYGFCTPRNTKINVKIDDVSYGSGVNVNVRCDSCGKEYQEKYYDYINHNHNGKCYCKKCADKILNSRENNSNWNKNKTDEERYIGRNYPEYTEFVKRVLARDNYTCRCCKNKVNKNANVHHLDGYNWCVEKRLDDDNAITLCDNCHSNFHSIHGYGNNTKKQFEEWIGKALTQLDKYDGILPTAKKIYDYEENKIYENAKLYSIVHNADLATIYRCCNHDTKLKKEVNKNGVEHIRKTKVNTVKGHHIFWLEEYDNVSQLDLREYFEKEVNAISLYNKTKVICITTKEIFESITDASKKYNIYLNGIKDCCIGKQKSAGKLPNGVPLQWMYYNEYLCKIKNGEDISIAIKDNHKKVICTTTGKIFDALKYAADYYNIKSVTSITHVCRNKKKSAGKLSDGTKLKWMYYEDFIKLSQEEQNEILSRNQESSNDGSFIM